MKGLTILLASAVTVVATLGVVNVSGIELGAMTTSTPSVRTSYKVPKHAPFDLTLKKKGKDKVSRALGRYAKNIERVEVMLDGHLRNPYATEDRVEKVASYTLKILLKDGAELRTSIRKCKSARLSDSIAATVRHCFAEYKKKKTKGMRAKVYANL